MYHHVSGERSSKERFAVQLVNTKGKPKKVLPRNGLTQLLENRLSHWKIVGGILHMNAPMHRLVLQFVFLPRMNRSISGFVESWNNHLL